MSDHIVMFASQGNPPDQQDDVISAGYMKSAYPKAVRLLKEENIQLRRKALFTISELLTNGTSCVQLIEEGLIGVLSECLDCHDDIVQERAVNDLNMIVNIVGSKGCEHLLKVGATEKLFVLLSSSSENVRQATYDVLINACKRSSEVQDLLCAMEGMLEDLLLKIESMGLADSHKALGLIRACLAGQRHQGDVTRRWVRAEVLSLLVRIINTTVDASLLDAATQLVSLLCLEPGTKKDVINAGIVAILIPLLKNHVQVETKTAAVAALMHLSVDVSGKIECMKFGITRSLVEGLKVREDDEKFLVNCLQCISNIAENKDGRDHFQVLEQKLEMLTNHSYALIQHGAALALRSIRFKVVGE